MGGDATFSCDEASAHLRVPGCLVSVGRLKILIEYEVLFLKNIKRLRNGLQSRWKSTEEGNRVKG